MDTTAIVLGIVFLGLVVLAALYGTGRIGGRGGRPGDPRRAPGVAHPTADAARPGEGDPARSARSAVQGMESRPPEAGEPPAR